MNQTRKLILGVALVLSSLAAHATIFGGASGYDKKQDDKIEQLQDRDSQLAADIHAVHMNTLTKYSESWGLEDRANIAKLQEEKLDKSVFAADQQRQDKALADAVSKQTATDSKQSTDLKGYADAKATSAYQTSVAHTDAKVARADADRAKGDAVLQAQITGNLASQAERDAGQDQHINAVQDSAQAANEKADAGAVRMDGIEKQAGVLDERVGKTETRLDTAEGAIRDTQGAAQTANDRATALEGRADNVEAVNVAQDAVLADHTQTLASHDGRITNAQKTADVAVKQGQQNTSDIVALYGEASYSASRIDAANANIEANRQALISTNKKVADNTAQLANHEQRIGELEQSSNRNFAALKDKVERNKKDADAGVAGVAAMASIPQVLESQTFALGAGVGNRHDQQALAVGFSARATQNVVVKVSAAADTNSGWTVGAGAAIGW